jgi:uncharacterized protein (DUF302 family)
MKTASRDISVKRVSVVSELPFEVIVATFDSLIGHPDMRAFGEKLRGATSAEELTQVVQQAVSEAGLMEFTRFDLGAVLKRRFGPQAGRSLRIVMGNPVTMSSMTNHVPDAGSYAPVTVLIDERSDGVHLTYDTMESHLMSYRNQSALQRARELDQQVLKVLEQAAG